jgi:hypothetical protein
VVARAKRAASIRCKGGVSFHFRAHDLRRTAASLQEAQAAGDVTMPLTREFKETVQARIREDRRYRKELLREGVQSLLAGDLDTEKRFCATTSTRQSGLRNSVASRNDPQKV